MVRLYPKVKVKGQDFTGAKVCVIPNQSMSLQEIVRKFVRREPINVSTNEGIYEERFGDLEKLKHADLVIQYERINELKEQIRLFKKKVADKEKADKEKAAADALAAQTNNGNGVSPLISPNPKGS